MEQKKSYLAIILIQSIYTGMFLLSKAAFNHGMNNFIFVFYRQAVATIFLIPFALFFEWKKAPRLSLVTFCKIFLLSLCGVTLSLDVYGAGLIYTSATLAAATTNCLPVITFFLAVLFRMEMLRLKTIPGIAKFVGILICFGGALTLAFFKGPHFKIPCFHHLFGLHQAHQTQGQVSSGMSWIKGCFFLLMSNTCWGMWLVLQGRVMKGYPSKLLFTTLSCFLSSVQSFVIAIALERNTNEWRLGWDLRLLAVAYCGTVVTGVAFNLQAWVIEKKGPVFLSMSTPLNLIFTMLCSVFLLCEVISLGSIMGGLLLVGGLYSVLWGKAREQKMEEGLCLPAADVEKAGSEMKAVTTH
ncbi:hypothetical protein SLEP1_g8545 [Rubroshorea leprosula]|uniref:WAT1-related protein n=1 Tax=Rubroshorea leprosula TaxID=152421 RepID=A0AAV5I232_9ROSI|nr:hypothetical protein SLEP1_g8545 [Rubroshorea leprosula]